MAVVLRLQLSIAEDSQPGSFYLSPQGNVMQQTLLQLLQL